MKAIKKPSTVISPAKSCARAKASGIMVLAATATALTAPPIKPMAVESTPLPVSLIHQIERERRNQHSGAERHDCRDQALRHAREIPHRRADEQRRPGDQSPASRFHPQ
jgi:hypothetical protein